MVEAFTSLTAFDSQPQRLDGSSAPARPTIDTIQHLTPEPQHQTQETQQLPHHGDKLIMMVNFLLREVVPLTKNSDQIKLLRYYLGAILSESILSPYTSLAYTITTNQNGELLLHDDVYQLRPDVLEVCRKAAESVTDKAEQRRYDLEHKQIKNLINVLETLLESHANPQAILAALLEQVTEPVEAQKHLLALGWQPTTQLISAEAARKLEISDPHTPQFAGQKIIYCMPQSEVHEGNMSVLVVVQPVYLPALHRVVLLHDQCFYPANWLDHLQLMERLGVTIPTEVKLLATKKVTKESAKIVEAFLMRQMISTDQWQTLPARAVFNRLLPKHKLYLSFKEWQKKQKLKKMEASITQYSILLIEVLNRETRSGLLQKHQVAKISQFLKRIILAGVLTQEQLTPQNLPNLVRLYQEHAHQPEKKFSTIASQAFHFKAATKAIDLSLLECVSVGSIKGINLQQTLLKLNLDPSAVTRKDIANAIGADRAKKWSDHQTCVACGKSDQWVGECGLCLVCELHPEPLSALSTTEVAASNKPPQNSPELSLSSSASISVSNLVASFI